MKVEPIEAIERKKASDFSPELWELFDEYVHGDIKRREFIERASKFAVGGVTGTMLWEMMRPHYLWAQQVPKTDSRIKAEYVMYPSPNGNSSNGQMRGILARPANGAKFPAIVVVHENRGLNPYVEDVVRRLATAALSPLDRMLFGPPAAIPPATSTAPKAMRRLWRCKET